MTARCVQCGCLLGRRWSTAHARSCEGYAPDHLPRVLAALAPTPPRDATANERNEP